MAKHDPRDYEAMSRAVEDGNYSVRGPLEMGATLHDGRPLDNDELRSRMYAEAAAIEAAETDEDDGAPLPDNVKLTRPNRRKQETFDEKLARIGDEAEAREEWDTPD